MPIDPGKVSEYAFTSEALKRDLVPCWPSTAMYPFDLVVASASRAHRVQIKATERIGHTIPVTAHKTVNGKAAKYTKEDVDFVVVHVVKLNLFYVIPIRMIKNFEIRLKPEDPRCPYARYKEAWSLLA
jgi:hypothetical protein